MHLPAGTVGAGLKPVMHLPAATLVGDAEASFVVGAAAALEEDAEASFVGASSSSISAANLLAFLSFCVASRWVTGSLSKVTPRGLGRRGC